MVDHNTQGRPLKRSWTTFDCADDTGSHAPVQSCEKSARLDHNFLGSQQLLPGSIDSGHDEVLPFDISVGYVGNFNQSIGQLQGHTSRDWSALPSANAFDIRHVHGILPDEGLRVWDGLVPFPTSLDITPVTASDPPNNTTISNGHFYGNIEASGQANVQNGDRHNHYGPGAQIHGTSYVLGDMIVNHSHHTVQQQLQNLTTNDADLELKKALYYEGMDARRAQLDIVDPASLEWIWSRTSFAQWLESDEPLYWISGKPASGKSTLTNHLIGRDRERLMMHLRKTHKNPLLIHFFFDFRSSSGIANSLVGFMRSLLLQLIDSSEHVRGHCLRHHSYRLPGDWPNDRKQLSTILIDALKGEERLICGMVDGLDEYQGDLRDLLDALRRLQASHQMKLCLSSRPDSRIAQQVGTASFEMQEQNSETITAYVDAAFSSLQSANIFICTSDLESLKREIRDRANGVVLWVKFAVGEVLDAFHNGDDTVQAIGRLEGLSTDLADVYARILGRLKTEQRVEAAVLLFVIQSWPRTGMIELHIESLLTFYAVVMKKVYKRRTGFLTQKDVSRFRLKLHSVLEGLVDIVDTEKHRWSIMGTLVVRLTHETLNAFLDRDEQTRIHKRAIERVFKQDCFVPQILADVVVMVSDAIDRSSVDSKILNTEGRGENLRILSQLAQDSPRAPGMYIHPDVVYRAWCLLERSDFVGLQGCKNCAKSFIRIAQSWVIQSFIRHAEDSYREELSGLSEDAWELWDDHLEVFELISWRQEFVLEVLLEQDLKYLSDEIKAELRQCLIKQKMDYGRNDPDVDTSEEEGNKDEDEDEDEEHETLVRHTV